MPENTVYVGRPSAHGNPHDWQEYRENFPKADAWDLDRDAWCREMAVGAFEEDVRDGRINPDIQALRGNNLACWCRLNQPCHADVLLELANAPEGANAPTTDTPSYTSTPSVPESLRSALPTQKGV